jgi:phosphatidylinositol-3,4,5-trisphosphate 3-phosphatase/dual-specificity protein phosphatase PTEN
MEENNEETVQETRTDLEQSKEPQIEQIKESQIEQPQEKETQFSQEQEKEPQIEQNQEQEKEKEPHMEQSQEQGQEKEKEEEIQIKSENTNLQSNQNENYEPQMENNQNIINKNKGYDLTNGKIKEESVEMQKEPTKENKINLPEEIEGKVKDSEYAKDLATPIPLSKQENYTHKNKLVPRYSFNELTQPQLAKIFKLKEETEEAIAKTVKNKQSSSLVKTLVSKKKNRFCYDGFDLDLTYITTRIIAMGLPSTSIEGLYRNSMDNVKKFLNTRHPSHYKVYNLCVEKTYPKDMFYKQGYFPFKDHEAPPLNLIRPFCEDAKNFLDEDEQNIIAVHCKAGKGRTGTFICCLMIYMNIFDNADECLQYYGMMRVENGKGLTVPSQIRYVSYFESILKKNISHPIVFVKKKIIKLRMFTLPMFHKVYTSSFTINNNENNYQSEKKKNIENENNDTIVDFNINNELIVEGDVQIIFYRYHVLGKKEAIFKFWFNTNFIPSNDNIYTFKKKSIDKACKDKECKYYKNDFKIEVHFADV